MTEELDAEATTLGFGRIFVELQEHFFVFSWNPSRLDSPRHCRPHIAWGIGMRGLCAGPYHNKVQEKVWMAGVKNMQTRAG